MKYPVLVLCGLLAACGGGKAGDDDSDAGDHGQVDSDDLGADDLVPQDDVPPPLDGGHGELDVFSPAVTDVALEIDYEPGAEPYTGQIVGFGDTFDTTVTNLDRLFAHKKALTIPRTLAGMQNIGAIADEELTVADLLAIADAHRDQLDSATRKSYYVLFVTGKFTDAGGPRPDVLGISLGRTGVTVLFKDAIKTTAMTLMPNVVKYVEQSTLVHETGHAIGLVNNGIPLRSAHQDAPHGAHCTNDKCVMFYTNEGAADATQFALTYVLSGSSILFDAACLADADALTGGL